MGRTGVLGGGAGKSSVARKVTLHAAYDDSAVARKNANAPSRVFLDPRQNALRPHRVPTTDANVSPNPIVTTPASGPRTWTGVCCEVSGMFWNGEYFVVSGVGVVIPVPSKSNAAPKSWVNPSAHSGAATASSSETWQSTRFVPPLSRWSRNILNAKSSFAPTGTRNNTTLRVRITSQAAKMKNAEAYATASVSLDTKGLFLFFRSAFVPNRQKTSGGANSTAARTWNFFLCVVTETVAFRVSRFINEVPRKALVQSASVFLVAFRSFNNIFRNVFVKASPPFTPTTNHAHVTTMNREDTKTRVSPPSGKKRVKTRGHRSCCAFFISGDCF
mmetsp:Transcript_11694/g.38867  ORF Transcript_11694/g.38867 Transcript_11694/m.38867 type:complete len:331 (+) Transcript_11694:241-1233(+)